MSRNCSSTWIPIFRCRRKPKCLESTEMPFYRLKSEIIFVCPDLGIFIDFKPVLDHFAQIYTIFSFFFGRTQLHLCRENLPRWVWNPQTKFLCNYQIINFWLVALVKGKCLSTKSTHLATWAVYHPGMEYVLQNPLALPGIELGTYCTTSENFPKVPELLYKL